MIKPPKRDVVVEIKGIEKEFSYDKWVERSAKLRIEKDQNAIYILYLRKYAHEKGWNIPVSWKSYYDLKFDRFQVEAGYQIDIHIQAARYSNQVYLTISFVPRIKYPDIFDIYVYEDNRQLQTFETNKKGIKPLEILFKKGGK